MSRRCRCAWAARWHLRCLHLLAPPPPLPLLLLLLPPLLPPPLLPPPLLPPPLLLPPLLLPPLLLLPLLLLPLLLLPLLLLLQHLPPPVPLLLPLPLPAMLPVLCAASEAQLPCILRRSQMLCSWTLLIDTSRPRPLPSEVKQGLGHIQAGGEDVHGHHRSGKASNRNTAHTSQRAPFQLAAGITPCFTAKAWSQAASTRV